MTDDDRALLARVEQLLQDIRRANEQRDDRVELISSRVTAIGSLLFGFASLAAILAAAYGVKRAAGDAIHIIGYVGLVLVFLTAIHSASKQFFRDPAIEQQRRELNAQRVRHGLAPIRDPTILELVAGYLVALLFAALIIGFFGGIGAAIADELFLSQSFGPLAQWGLGAAVGSLVLLGIALLTFDWLSYLKSIRSEGRNGKLRR
jgi:hypothetical protein